VLGRKGVLKQDWRASPDSLEPHFNRNPRIAAKSKWARVEAFTRNKASKPMRRLVAD